MINFNFLTPFICGIIFMLVGILQLLFPPKKINGIYGYRTQSSKQSQARWDFAQLYSAKQMIILGGILSAVSSVWVFITLDKNTSVVIALLLLACMVAALTIRVERAIKNRFDDTSVNDAR